jgi:hypothetical protein
MMIAETIGIIGYEHGSRLNTTPATKYSATIVRKPCPEQRLREIRAGDLVEPAARCGRTVSRCGSAERRAVDLHDVFGGRVADPFVGAPLRRHRELERPGRLLDRHVDHDVVAIGFDFLLERLVELHVAGRKLRRTERRIAALHREREPLAVKVIAVGDLEADVDLSRGFARAELECDRRIEKIVGRARDRQAAQHQHERQQSRECAARARKAPYR